MRVLVATDTIGALSSSRAGRVLATGWAADIVTVLSLGESGAGFAQAMADSLGAELVFGMVGERMVGLARAHGTTVVALETAGTEQGAAAIPFDASSVELGRAVADVLELEQPRRLVLDLARPAVHDGGAGMLAALGAEADVPLDQGVVGLRGLARLDLQAVRARLADIELVGVVPADQLAQQLVGLRGITSLRRGPGLDPEQLLETDATLTTLARLAGPELAHRSGAGACGGLGLAVLALGGRLTTGPRYGFETEAAQQAATEADLVVTGCTVFDFATRGGGVVAEAARVAGERLAPCIAVAAEVLIGSREMRTMGIESAYPVRDGRAATTSDDVTEHELMDTARRVARSWRW